MRCKRGFSAGPLLASGERVSRNHMDGRIEEVEHGGLDENYSREETRVHHGQVDEVVGAHAVADADEVLGHLVAEVVNHEEEVARVVHPCR